MGGLDRGAKGNTLGLLNLRLFPTPAVAPFPQGVRLSCALTSEGGAHLECLLGGF